MDGDRVGHELHTSGGTITKDRLSYWSGPSTAQTGAGSRTPGQSTAAEAAPLSTTVTAFRGSKGPIVAATSTSWQPTLVISIPASALPGAYSCTITHSVA